MNAASPRQVLTACCLVLLGGCATTTHAPPASPATAPAAVPATPAASNAPTAAAGMEMADHHHMDGMDGMDGMNGGHAITMPAGALFTVADVQFMQGMIAHHGQAIYMSRMAASHGASARLQRFARKIDQSQAGEIVLMQGWLRANGQFAPDTSAWRGMSMPGMLTAEELAGLEASHNATFERQFLTLMIRHHEGALRMVTDLHATPRAAQDVDVSVIADDVRTTQTAEIGLMRQMLIDQ